MLHAVAFHAASGVIPTSVRRQSNSKIKVARSVPWLITLEYRSPPGTSNMRVVCATHSIEAKMLLSSAFGSVFSEPTKLPTYG